MDGTDETRRKVCSDTSRHPRDQRALLVDRYEDADEVIVAVTIADMLLHIAPSRE